MRVPFLPLAAPAAIALTAACALAFNAPSTTLEKAVSGIYEIDAAHTNVLFGLSHMGFSNYYGRFNSIKGSLTFDAEAPEKSALTVTIDIAGIDTNNEKLESELKNPQWFDAARFPTTTFTSTRIEKLTDTTGKVTGNLTLHGITRPVTLDVTFNGAGLNPIANVEELGFSAKAVINRSDFGISQYIPMVGNMVNITIETELHLKK